MADGEAVGKGWRVYRLLYDTEGSQGNKDAIEAYSRSRTLGSFKASK